MVERRIVLPQANDYNPCRMSPASVCVFLGSTRGDLDTDCRPSARRGIEIGRALVEEMDTWDSGYENAVVLCRRKVQEDSSHYLGLFAYRRGWEPTLGLSITEAEFDWALECRQPGEMAVFLPNPTSDFARELRERARTQDDAETQAQEAFLKRVACRGSYMVFDDPIDLACRVTRTVLRWVGGGLRFLGQAGSVRGEADTEPLLLLGRKQQQRQFEDTLEVLPAMCRAVCFLLHGPAGYGHDDLARRFRLDLERQRTSLRCVALPGGGVPWRGSGAGSLAVALARELGLEEGCSSFPELAGALQDQLDLGDVVLEIGRVQKLEGSLHGFVQAFWRPLVMALSRPPRHRLIVLALVEREAPVEWATILQEPSSATELPSAFDPTRPVRLAPLTPFTHEEVARWLGRFLPREQAAELAGDLIGETGGHPRTLRERLGETDFHTGEEAALS